MTFNSDIVEFNSNAFVIKRVNDIIDSINFNKRLRNVEGMLDDIVDLYKEIDIDLNDTEREVWEEIQKVKKMTQFNRGESFNGSPGTSVGRIIAEFDEVDIKVRRLAKKHGFLTTNKENIRMAITKR